LPNVTGIVMSTVSRHADSCGSFATLIDGAVRIYFPESTVFRQASAGICYRPFALSIDGVVNMFTSDSDRSALWK
jgi:hypothetical protein